MHGKTSRIIVVGMNPSAAEKVKKNSTMDRLNKWMDQFGVKHFTFINLFNYPKAVPTKDDIDYDGLKVVHEYDKVIALGGMVSTAITKIGKEHFRMPHPSPRNRQFNDKEFEPMIVNKCMKYLEE